MSAPSGSRRMFDKEPTYRLGVHSLALRSPVLARRCAIRCTARRSNQPPAAPLMSGLAGRLRRGGNELGEDLFRHGKSTSFGGGFVMTDELMLFLALVAALIVVLVEWWSRRTP